MTKAILRMAFVFFRMEGRSFTRLPVCVMRNVAISLSTDCSYDMSMLRQPKWIKIVAICFLGGLAFFLIFEFN
jgi:hypothetical protein